jgi:lysozyme
MRTSAQGLNLIMQSEGFRPTAYKDVAGIPTIGYGHRIQPGESGLQGSLTQPEAQALLARDVGIAEEAVLRLVKVALSQGQFDALVDFVFNLGAGRLASSTLLRELNARNYAAAGEQILLWDRAAGSVNPGLQRRRQAEFSLFTDKSATVPDKPGPSSGSNSNQARTSGIAAA